MSKNNRTDKAIDIYKAIHEKIHNDEKLSNLNKHELDSITSQVIQIQINIEDFENNSSGRQTINQKNIFPLILILSPFILILVYLLFSVTPKIYPTSNPPIQENNKVID